MSPLFHFLSLAIGNRETFPYSLSDADWHRLYLFCKRQALVGVGFTAVEKLHSLGVECPKALKVRWLSHAMLIENRNRLMNEQCHALTTRYEHDGIRCCILKGQGNLLNYPEEFRLRRTPGDIDVWCVAPVEGLDIAVQTGKDVTDYERYHGTRAVMEYVRMQHRIEDCRGKYNGDRDAVLRYHHIEAPILDGTPVEVHFRVGFLNSPLRNIRLQRWFDGQADVCMKNKTQMGFSVPTPSVNVVYQMKHLFSHYLDEGVGLRQLMDYYFTLKRCHDDYMEKHDLQSQGMWTEGLGMIVLSREEVMCTLRSFGMGKFAAAVMWVLHEVFAMPAHYYICEPDERRGRQLLEEIILAGNFGQNDERGRDMKNGGMVRHGLWKLKRVMRLVRNYPEEALCEPIFRVWHLGWRFVQKVKA